MLKRPPIPLLIAALGLLLLPPVLLGLGLTMTSVAEVMVRPSPSSTGGSSKSPSAAISNGIGGRFNISSASLEPHDALAEQAARPEQQHQQHQKIDRRGGSRGIADADHDAFDEADQ